MKIAKPLLLVTTPIGVVGGLHEAWRLAGGLVFLMLAMLLVVGAAVGTLVMTIRRERAEQEARDRASDAREPATTGTEPAVARDTSARDSRAQDSRASHAGARGPLTHD